MTSLPPSFDPVASFLLVLHLHRPIHMDQSQSTLIHCLKSHLPPTPRHHERAQTKAEAVFLRTLSQFLVDPAPRLYLLHVSENPPSFLLKTFTCTLPSAEMAPGLTHSMANSHFSCVPYRLFKIIPNSPLRLGHCCHLWQPMHFGLLAQLVVNRAL